jgi:hypothetical protein
MLYMFLSFSVVSFVDCTNQPFQTTARSLQPRVSPFHLVYRFLAGPPLLGARTCARLYCTYTNFDWHKIILLRNRTCWQSYTELPSSELNLCILNVFLFMYRKNCDSSCQTYSTWSQEIVYEITRRLPLRSIKHQLKDLCHPIKDPIRPIFPGQFPFYGFHRALSWCLTKFSCGCQMSQDFIIHKNMRHMTMHTNIMTSPQWEKTCTGVGQLSASH